ncbi:2-dehydropantoate 2-reductase [Fusarium keratoplasticum]|uniref:2-dehydropantoate 2-reductase n=1 Tax=Fusarium keratoplasticum TaxID=1328300 RepID=A0ACC0R5H0_9HYPO|nr:2-dehydropantoate 2-reductase [Fusarium keratoplasticum]KAI8671840.1 2-dehydropantoate 2-reductase [Fusarium keratoplasticum]KAI8679057.1 2-dehydropantoate 2-reductase [Fusarium keratoplasticum]
MARILLLGVGSIGSVYALIFTRAGAEVVCVCRSNFEAAKTSGLRIESVIFGDQTINPAVVSSVDEAVHLSEQPFDFVVICTKSFPGAQQQTVKSLAPALQDSTTAVVLFQNGIGVEIDYQKGYPANPIISGVVYMPTTRTSAVSVKHSEGERLYLGSFPSTASQDHVHSLSSVLRAGGATVHLSEDVQGERWKKIVANGAWNPIGALSRCRDIQFLQAAPLASHVVLEIMREICTVAAACGYAQAANEETIKFQMSRTHARQYPGVEPSMMSDMHGGLPMEVEAILGGILAFARERSVSVPRLETLYVLLAGLNDSLQKNER